jgi:TatD DNase family protein
MVSYVDTHCHLDLFADIRNSVSVEDETAIKTITVTNAPFLWKHNNLLFKDCRNIRPALGFHPELAAKRVNELDLFKTLSKDIKYIGEIGLDGSIIHKETKAEQLKVFQTILSFLKPLEKKIITIHSRNAAERTIAELSTTLKNTEHKVILHWFTGSINELNVAIKEGFYFSVNHKMLNSKRAIEILKNIPKERIVTETDAPFTFDERVMTRQRSLNLTIDGLAALWKMSYQDTKDKVYLNFKDLLIK